MPSQIIEEWIIQPIIPPHKIISHHRKLPFILKVTTSSSEHL
ncbi:hypothetical protein R0011_06012 [Lacticaseibacillus rhamnosus R0011]|nr:hypothetical protein LRH_11894 [Lacticaseibacillus rhamnosus HN001]EHJ22825.1 hypothetical protein R0011_06012 [Lacticaseibacillus rhamnosus R0011]